MRSFILVIFIFVAVFAANVASDYWLNNRLELGECRSQLNECISTRAIFTPDDEPYKHPVDLTVEALFELYTRLYKNYIGL